MSHYADECESMLEPEPPGEEEVRRHQHEEEEVRRQEDEELARANAMINAAAAAAAAAASAATAPASSTSSPAPPSASAFSTAAGGDAPLSGQLLSMYHQCPSAVAQLTASPALSRDVSLTLSRSGSSHSGIGGAGAAANTLLSGINSSATGITSSGLLSSGALGLGALAGLPAGILTTSGLSGSLVGVSVVPSTPSSSSISISSYPPRPRRLVLGVCAMDKKTRSKPMTAILDRLRAYGEFDIHIFGDRLMLDTNIPVEQWPRCHCLISFASAGFPLAKVIEYVRLRKPFCE
jgi:hypothetical protein